MKDLRKLWDRLLDRFQGANISPRATCGICGKRRQCGEIHQIGYSTWRVNERIDHAYLCSECWKNIPKGWCPCGCGG